jgi:hypothetical protein
MRGSAIAASLALSLMALRPRRCSRRRRPSRRPLPACQARGRCAGAAGARAACARSDSRAAARTVPGWAKIASPQAVFQASADGRAAATRVNALIQKQTENADKAKLLQNQRSCRPAAA